MKSRLDGQVEGSSEIGRKRMHCVGMAEKIVKGKVKILELYVSLPKPNG